MSTPARTFLHVADPDFVALIPELGPRTAGVLVGDSVCPLGARDLEKLVLVAEGKTNKEIALKLGLESNSIKAALAIIAQKLFYGGWLPDEYPTRAGLVGVAMREGWLW